MNSRVTGIVLPIVAVILYIIVDFCYIFLAKSRYEAAVVNIQKGDKMEIDAAAAVICYSSKNRTLFETKNRSVSFL